MTQKKKAQKEEAQVPVPDLLGVAGKAQVLADSIQGLQQQRFRTETMQVVNDAADDDLVPTSNGSSVTYAQRLQQIDSAIERLAKENPELMMTVQALIQAKAQAEAQG